MFVNKMSEKDETCRLLFPKAQDDVFKCLVFLNQPSTTQRYSLLSQRTKIIENSHIQEAEMREFAHFLAQNYSKQLIDY